MDFIDIMQIMAFSALFGYVFAMMSGVSPEDVPRGRSSRDSGAQKRIKPGYLILLLVVVGSISFARDVMVGCTPLGTTTIDGALEKGEYSEDYYVFAFPDDSDALNYRVKAQIHSYTKLESMELIRRYEVERIELPEGIHATFESHMGSGYSLEPDRKVMVRDDNGRRWGIQLTRDKVLK